MSRSARWAFLESLLSAGSSMLTVLLLARFLSPSEFGLAGLAVATSSILQATALGGMPDALVRSPSAHTRFTDAAFWWFLGIGGATSLICVAAALFVDLALHQRQLAALIAVQGLTGIALGAAAVPTGLLLRKMRTRALVHRTAISKATSMIVSVALAWGGAGAWALVLGSLVSQSAGAAQLLATMRRPRLRFWDPAIPTALRIGAMTGAQTSISTVTTRGFILAFGAAYGAHAAGLLNFALRLVEESCGLVVNTLRRVTVTSFAAARRGGLDVKALFMRGTSMIAYVAAPLFLGGAAVAPDAVPLVFGKQWTDAIPALQLLLVMWVVRSARMLVSAILVVDGRQRPMLILGLVAMFATALAFALSLPFGMNWSIASYAVTLIGVVLGGGFFRRNTGITPRQQVGAPLRPILFALAMAATVIALHATLLADMNPAFRLPALIAIGGAIFIALAAALDRKALRDVLRFVRR